MTTPIVSRLAPTPSGFLHLGNAYSFGLTWRLTRQHQGTLWLRIDDLDATRCRPEYLADIFDTLTWLGLNYDRGPRDPADFAAHFSQMLRLPLYHGLLTHLRAAGVVYACDCSRRVAGSGIYPGTCRNRNLPLDQPGVAWRARVPAGTTEVVNDLLGPPRPVRLDEAMGDFVVRRRDGTPAYQVASLADDLHLGCNLLVRGLDLLPSSAAQLWLARHLPPNPFGQVNFHHHPLLTDAQGHKLSKSAGAAALRDAR